MRIHLLGSCGAERCIYHAGQHKALMDVPQYRDGQAVGVVADIETWRAEHGTARRRANLARRLGFTVRRYEPGERYEEIVAINRSKYARQGRKMDDHYVSPARVGHIGEPECPYHHTLCYGVFNAGDVLKAYSTIHRRGDLIHVSMFLGDAHELERGVMYLLVEEILRDQAPGVLYYNRMDSGTDGLRFFKARIGLHEEDVEWTL